MTALEFSQLLGNYGEFVGAIAVVATLIYLAAQIRQNSLQLRLNSFQISSERYTGLIVSVLDNPARLAMFRDGLQSYSALDPDQQAQFHAHMVKAINAYTNNRQLLDAGTITGGICQLTV